MKKEITIGDKYKPAERTAEDVKLRPIGSDTIYIAGRLVTVNHATKYEVTHKTRGLGTCVSTIKAWRKWVKEECADVVHIAQLKEKTDGE